MIKDEADNYSPSEKKKLAALRQKYFACVEWNRQMGGYDYYINQQVLKAEADGAPTDAIFNQHDPMTGKLGKKWRRASELAPDHKFRVWYEKQVSGKGKDGR